MSESKKAEPSGAKQRECSAERLDWSDWQVLLNSVVCTQVHLYSDPAAYNCLSKESARYTSGSMRRMMWRESPEKWQEHLLKVGNSHLLSCDRRNSSLLDSLSVMILTPIIHFPIIMIWWCHEMCAGWLSGLCWVIDGALLYQLVVG